MKKIKLTQGLYAIVSDEDFDELNKYKWHASRSKSGKIYAVRHNRGWPKVKPKSMSMHRQILMVEYGRFVDHIDENGLNNQRDNIRICTKAENNRYRGKFKLTKGKYKGVRKLKSGKFKARICCNNMIYDLGMFYSEREAALAYNRKAEELHGEFAILNIIL